MTDSVSGGQPDASGRDQKQAPDIAARLAEIVADRKRRADDLEAERSADRVRSRALRDLADRAEEIAAEQTGELASAIGRLSAAAAEASTALADGVAKVDALTARWRSGRVTVGVAGVARQGKSTLLQSVSGLSGDLIPADDGLPLTGARSQIVARPGPAAARVEFLSEAEFLRTVVGGFYSRLNLGPPPTWSQFMDGPPPLPEGSTAADRTGYENLRTVRGKADAVRPLLGAPPRDVPVGEVRSYILKRDGDRDLAAYLAVKQMTLLTPFPSIASPHVSLIDLPGLGDLSMDFAATLLDTTRREVDAVVYVKMPSKDGDQWSETDVAVFDVVERAMRPRSLPESMTVLLNLNGSNDAIAGKLRDSLPEAYAGCPLVLASAKDPAAAQAQVFLPVLRNLAENLPSLDARAAEDAVSGVGEASASVDAAWAELGPLLDRGVGDGATQFHKPFRAFLRNLKVSLDGLLQEYHPEGPAEAAVALREEVRTACSESLAEATAAFPAHMTAEWLTEAKAEAGAWGNVVRDGMRVARTGFGHALAAGTERRLNALIERVRGELVARFRETPLGNIMGPGLDSTAVLLRLADEAAAERAAGVAEGMRFLANFRVGYHDMLHPAVRRNLKRLDPNAEVNPVGQLPDSELTKSDRPGEMLLAFLQTYYAEAAADAGRSLERAEADVPWAVYATLEEFVDRLVRSGDHEEEWMRLLEPRRHEIFPGEYAEVAGAIAVRNALTGAAAAAGVAA